MEPLVITVAPTGSSTTREHTPYVPLTPVATVAEARRILGLPPLAEPPPRLRMPAHLA